MVLAFTFAEGKLRINVPIDVSIGARTVVGTQIRIIEVNARIAMIGITAFADSNTAHDSSRTISR